jgi:midasin (ATPase involved in ribosome maturation)
MFGRALEAVCRDLLFTKEEKKEIREGKSKKRLMLAEGIKQLREKGLIDDRLYDWSQHLHAFRNIAAHPDVGDVSITREDAEDLQVFVYAIIEYIYDLADRYEEFKERQQKRSKTKKNPFSSLWGDDD